MKPELRKQGLASRMADRVAAEAREKGAKEMLGSVQLSAKGSTASLKVLLAYGFELFNSGADFIFLKKSL